MTTLSGQAPRERLQNALHKEPTDRPPVICMGGMMNAAIIDVMNSSSITLPAAHFDSQQMAGLAEAVSAQTGFENIAVPFCMTVEAELLGSEIDHGTLECEPKIAKEAFASAGEVSFQSFNGLPGRCRARTVIESVRRLKAKGVEQPVVASLTGPVSTAASWVDPLSLIKDMRRRPADVLRVLEHVTEVLFEYARELTAAGADAIALGDPTATGEILGPAHFRNYAVPYLNDLIDRIHKLGAPVIVHICGDIAPVADQIPNLRGDAISTDAMVNLKALKAAYPALTTMGNVSTYLLEFGNPEKIRNVTRRLVHDGIDIIAPACGLSTSTTLNNIQALTQTVKEEA